MGPTVRILQQLLLSHVDAFDERKVEVLWINSTRRRPRLTLSSKNTVTTKLIASLLYPFDSQADR